VIENIHRRNLNRLEEGAAYAQLHTDFGCTHD
jgi:ParB family chromosome partitioning protein